MNKGEFIIMKSGVFVSNTEECECRTSWKKQSWQKTPLLFIYIYIVITITIIIIIMITPLLLLNGCPHTALLCMLMARDDFGHSKSSCSIQGLKFECWLLQFWVCLFRLLSRSLQVGQRPCPQLPPLIGSKSKQKTKLLLSRWSVLAASSKNWVTNHSRV